VTAGAEVTGRRDGDTVTADIAWTEVTGDRVVVTGINVYGASVDVGAAGSKVGDGVAPTEGLGLGTGDGIEVRILAGTVVSTAIGFEGGTVVGKMIIAATGFDEGTFVGTGVILGIDGRAVGELDIGDNEGELDGTVVGSFTKGPQFRHVVLHS
jgi:hypothetical protein